MASRRSRLRRHSSHATRGLVALRVFGVGMVIVVAILVAGATVAFAVASSWLDGLPEHNSADAFSVAEATHVYSADGALLAKLYLENRTVVPLSEIATDLVDAIVAVEDERFYTHNGVDALGIARAAMTNLAAGSTREGASTITQQYVRNTLLLEERTDITFERKLREAYLAYELEKQRSKSDILHMYLNTIYFGEGAYGAQAASQTFFSKDALDLTLGEAALLAGLPQQPSRLSPYDNMEGATRRRAQVLTRMLENGFITQEQHDTAVAEPVELRRSDAPADGIYEAHYFVAHVKKILQQQYSAAVVFKGGLNVYTTLDTRMQAEAENAVHSALDRPGDPDGALVAIDPRDGHIKALVGGKDFATNKFNLATQGSRQPGSSFKTFVLVAALEEGIPPTKRYDSSSPATIPTKPKAWRVSNSEGSGRGFITLDSATRSSVNTVFARLIWDIGAEKVVDTAKRMGITTQIPELPSIGLGSSNVTPLEMASAYGTLAAQGVHYEPTAITKVVGPGGDVLFEAEPKGTTALTPEIAGETTRILRGVITGGTARRAAIGRPAAGKTGTSQNYRDAWFVGYTPQLVTAVWVGHYQTEQPMRSVHGVRGFGGTLSAPIWATFMKAALAGQPELDFPATAKPVYSVSAEPEYVDVDVPGVVGIDVATARETLLSAGFGVKVVEGFHDSAPAGQVVSQSPSGSARQGSEITLQVSKGKAPVAEPPPAPEPEPEPEPKPKPPPPTPEPTSTPSG